MKSKINLKNILYYLQGNIRYELYDSRFSYLIKKHIREQIDCRINSMNSKCYTDGQCELCGCKTTALQMCNKSCEKPCYPPILNKEQWNSLVEGWLYLDKNTGLIWLLNRKNKFEIVINTI